MTAHHPPSSVRAQIDALGQLLQQENALLMQGDVHGVAALLPRKRTLVAAVEGEFAATNPDEAQAFSAHVREVLDHALLNRSLLGAAIETHKEIVTLLITLPGRQDGYDAAGQYRRGGVFRVPGSAGGGLGAPV